MKIHYRKVFARIVIIGGMIILNACEPKETFGSLSGRVTDTKTNDPVPGVIINISSNGSRNTTSDSDGSYSFGELPTGNYEISTIKAGYLNYRTPRPIEINGQTIKRDIQLEVPFISLSPTTYNAPSTQGATNIAITSNTAWNTVSSEPSWLTTTKTGTGNGTLEVTYTANAITNTRTGIITVQAADAVSQIFTLRQEGIAPFLTINNPNIQVPSSAGQTSLSIMSNINWTAMKTAEWISTITPETGTGNTQMSITTLENTTGSTRTGTITFSGTGVTNKIVNITQTTLLPTLAVSPSTQNVPHTATTTSFSVTSNTAWLAMSNQTWATIPQNTSNGNGTLIVALSINTASVSRTATITVSTTGVQNKNVTITQAEFLNCTYSLSPSSNSYSAIATTGTFNLTASANSGCTPWTASASPSWITITSATLGTGSTTVNFSLSANTSSSARTGTINVAGQTFTITQAGEVVCSYSLSPSSNSYSAIATTGTFNLTASANSGCTPWTASASPSWITITSATLGTGSTTVNFSLSANTSSSARTGTINVAGQTFTITQSVSSGNNPSTKTITAGGVSFTVNLIPAGTFTMGCVEGRDAGTGKANTSCPSDQLPTTNVTLTRDFYMMTTEVTQTLWKAVMNNTNPSSFPNCGTCPVETVSWTDVHTFIAALNTATGMTFRLPTEAEWEYAARGGQNFQYAGSDNITDVSWYGVNSSNTTHPVAQKVPNGYGLYDMTGNVWEWCSDWYGDYSGSAVSDPTGPSSSSSRVMRGGSWNRDASNCAVSVRYFISPSFRNFNIGFRLTYSL
ncbi:MAG: SUMF1/EgtB/PvdO family nonheme iron enzyme [Chitinophagaceae bacterium]|nr:SUMF1/EgtB/PvdO family nonheme iron enzyme [Chitinophagaceae bacterium]